MALISSETRFKEISLSIVEVFFKLKMILNKGFEFRESCHFRSCAVHECPFSQFSEDNCHLSRLCMAS